MTEGEGCGKTDAGEPQVEETAANVGAEDAVTPTEIARPPGTGHTRSGIAWPRGPHYFELTGSEGSIAWMRYRVWSADWHVRTLHELADADASLDRHVGVEMALDGVLNGLSSAFDAGVGLLIRTAEELLEVPSEKRLRSFEYRWSRCRDLLKQPSIAQDGRYDTVWRLILDVENALDGEKSDRPLGWLAQLRRLRNRVAHQDGLSRAHNIGGTEATRLIFNNVEVDAPAHLAASCDRMFDLTEQMITLGLALGLQDASTQWDRGRWSHDA